jgi:hypothetical protein
VQFPRRAPFGLPDRLGRPTRHRVGVAPVEGGNPELRAVPGHVRVVPAGECEPLAVRADSREGVEVTAAGQHRRLAGAVGGDGNDLVDRLAAGMRLADAHDLPPVGGGAAVGVSEVALRRDRPRRLPRVLPVEPLVPEVREEDRLAVQQPGAAAVLVHTGPHVEPFRRDVLERLTRASAYEHRATALGGSPLEPPGRAVRSQERLREPGPRASNELGRDRRAPGAEGRCLRHGAAV